MTDLLCTKIYTYMHPNLTLVIFKTQVEKNVKVSILSTQIDKEEFVDCLCPQIYHAEEVAKLLDKTMVCIENDSWWIMCDIDKIVFNPKRIKLSLKSE